MTSLQIFNLYTAHKRTNNLRVTATTATLIDHFFTTHPDKVRAVKVAKIGLSDHYTICAVLKAPLVKKNCHTSITYRMYKDFDFIIILFGYKIHK